MTKVQTPAAQEAAAEELPTLDTRTEDATLDLDKDGMVDIDPAKAQLTALDLVTLDHELRDQGSSIAQLLRIYARTSQGIRF